MDSDYVSVLVKTDCMYCNLTSAIDTDKKKTWIGKNQTAVWYPIENCLFYNLMPCEINCVYKYINDHTVQANFIQSYEGQYDTGLHYVYHVKFKVRFM